MPVRLILILLLVVFEGAFIGFNLDNKCDVWLLFRVFKSVPVYITILVSFAAGILVSVPFFVFKKKNVSFDKNKKPQEMKKVREKETPGFSAGPAPVNTPEKKTDSPGDVKE